jgi:hypothetical protein
MKNAAGLCFLIIVIVMSFSPGCRPADQSNPADMLIAEKDIIPEGLTVDDSTGTIYISSTYKRKIISIDKEGRIRDFIPEKANDIKSVIGMEADSKRGLLWAISSEAGEVLPLIDPGVRQWWSSVFCFSIPGGKLLKQYPLQRDSVFLNDLTVSLDGRVFATETRNNGIYMIPNGGDSLELWLRPIPYTFLNGICFSKRPGFMFVSCAEGILLVELDTRHVRLLPVAPGVDAKDIDGLSFYNGSLIGHQSTKLTRFFLTPGNDSITHSLVINSGPAFDGTTTGEPAGNQYYFIVNSQIQSGVNFKNRTIKPADSLEPVIIRKINLAE